MPVSSRNELIEYCLRKLGHPVTEINVDVDQIEDRIDDAFEFYQDYHYDATEHNFYAHLLTAQNIQDKYVTVPEELIFVKQVLAIEGFNNIYKSMGDNVALMNNPFAVINTSAKPVGFAGNNEQLGRNNSISDYFLTMSSLEQMRNVLGSTSEIPIRFNRHTNRIYFDSEVQDVISEGQYILFEGWIIVDPETFNDVYNDRWLKRYATSLIKQQWGINLSKYSGIQLPGGVTLDGDKIYEQASTEIEKLEEEMQLKYELPVNFISG